MSKACFLAILFPVVFFVSDGRCEWVTGVSIEDVSSEYTDFGRLAVNTINGSELVGDRHRATNGDGMWYTDSGQFDPSTNNFAHITFDLGANYDLDQVDIWNYGETGEISNSTGATRSGVKDFRISVASSETAPFTSLGDFSLARAEIPFVHGYLFEGESFSIPATNAKLVRFDIFSSYFTAENGWFDRPVGLSEVAFTGSLTAVPEPSSLILFSTATLGLVTQRRRSS